MGIKLKMKVLFATLFYLLVLAFVQPLMLFGFLCLNLPLCRRHQHGTILSREKTKSANLRHSVRGESIAVSLFVYDLVEFDSIR